MGYFHNERTYVAVHMTSQTLCDASSKISTDAWKDLIADNFVVPIKSN
jgi:hypothetical protein